MSALRTARGTVRDGSRISPDGVSATSTPTNANNSTIDTWPTSDTVGIGARRNSGFSDQTPTSTSTSSGMSLAAVIVSTSRMPGLMPRILTTARAANSRTRRIARGTACITAGQNTPTEPANAVATDATDRQAVAQ